MLLRVVAAALVLSYAPATELCRFQDPAVDESSGVADGPDGSVLWTHNDSGDAPRFYAVDRATGATRATFTVDGARADDWEDMARGLTPDGRPALLFADIGDNFRRRPTVTIYEVAEPADPSAAAAVPLVARRDLRYDDGPHDAETLLVDPRDGALYVVAKTQDGIAGVYRADGDVLRRVGEVRLDKLVRRGGAYAKAVTSGDIAPDGRVVVLRTPFEAFEWALDGDVVAAFARTPRRIALPATDQGEAIAYTRDGRSLLTTSEGLGAPVHLVRGDRVPGPDLLAPQPQPQPQPQAELHAREVRGERPWELLVPVAVAAGLVAIAGLSALRGRRRRRRRPPRGRARPA